LTPDLGDLIQYLTITDKLSWDDIKEAFVQEAVRRNALHIGKVHLPSITGGVDGLLNKWLEGTNAGKVTLFCVLFLQVVARPKGKTIPDIKQMYDSRWGRLQDEVLAHLKDGCHEILQLKSLPEIFSRLGLPRDKEAIAELILWAFDNIEESPKVNYQGGIPHKGGIRLLEWQERHKIWIKASEFPPKELQWMPPLEKKLKPTAMTGVAAVLKTLSINKAPTQKSHHFECACKRCIRQIDLDKKIKEWHSQVDNNFLNPQNTLFIARLNYQTTENTLQQYFATFGEIRHVRLVRDINGGKSRGYGFIEFGSCEAVTNVLSSHSDKQNKGAPKSVNIDGRVAVLDRVKGKHDQKFIPSKLGGIHPHNTRDSRPSWWSILSEKE